MGLSKSLLLKDDTIFVLNMTKPNDLMPILEVFKKNFGDILKTNVNGVSYILPFR